MPRRLKRHWPATGTSPKSSAKPFQPRRPASKVCPASSSTANLLCRAHRPRNISLKRSRASRGRRTQPNKFRRIVMKITAAVVRERSVPFTIEQLDLCDPRDDELLVEVVASGMCATDLHGRDAYYPTKFPKVFGHEGAGIVRAVGNKVSTFKPGDHVVMAYPWCGDCPNCRTQRQSYCLHAFDLKMNGTRADGSTLHSKNGKPVYSAFFQQSSFGNFTIANERFAVKVRNDVPLTSVSALACGGQTGAGAVLNVMKPRSGDSFVVFGVGAVGLSG